MFQTLLLKLKTLSVPIDEMLIARSKTVAAMNARDVEILYARVFSSEDGQKVLTHLQLANMQRSSGPNATDAQLRHAEGQRALVSNILRLVQRGRSPI